jgi:hypothetical protein
MTRINVFRGNEYVPCLPIFDLTATSSRWSLLTPEERDIATQTAGVHLITPLASAGLNMWECLKGLRLARTVGEWRDRSTQLERVKAVLLKDDDENTRKKYLEATRVRYILLGAAGDQGQRNAHELVESVLLFRTAGDWRPFPARPPFSVVLADHFNKTDPKALPFGPRRIEDVPITMWEFDPKDPDEAACHAVERDATVRRWDEDAELLANRNPLWTDKFRDDELRAFPDDPVCPYLTARGRVVDAKERGCALAAVAPLPGGFTRSGVEVATRHVKNLILIVRRLIHRAANAKAVTPEVANHAVCDLNQLDCLLREGWVSQELRERLHRRDNYSVGGAVRPSVHEALVEYAGHVFWAFREAINSVSPAATVERDRMRVGPWQWHEMMRALPVVKQERQELISALDDRKYQELAADLDRESALLLAQAPSTPSNGNNQNPGGRKRLTSATDPKQTAKRNVYELIRTARDEHPGWGPQALFQHFKADKQFCEQATVAGVKVAPKLFRAAIKWIDANPADHKT